MEASLYYGMIWRGLVSGTSAYLLLALPPFPSLQLTRVGIATLVFVALVVSLVVGWKGSQAGRLSHVDLAVQNVLANGAVALGMWATGNEQGSLVPLFFVIIIYNSAFAGKRLMLLSWFNGTAAHLVGTLLSGEPTWPAIAATAVFAGAAAGAQLSVAYVFARLRRLTADLELEREIAATAARAVDSDAAYQAMLPRAAELLDVATLALVQETDADRRVLYGAGRAAGRDVALEELDLDRATVLGSSGGERLLLCVGVDEEPDGATLAAVRDLFLPVVERTRYLTGLRLLAQSDGLTGLANRRHLDETLDALARSHLGFSVIILDLDLFKEVNDRRGHLAGDDVLVAAADVLRSVARTGDLAARYGGEEFCLVIPSEDVEAAAGLERRLRTAWQQEHLPVSFSAGIAAWHPGESGQDVLRRADQALYDAKAGGRGRAMLAE